MQDQKFKVEIFSTPQCHYCHMAKDWFTQHKIEFADYDVTQDFARRQELIHLGAMGVPLIRITGEGITEPIIVNGFDVDHLKQVLDIKQFLYKRIKICYNTSGFILPP